MEDFNFDEFKKIPVELATVLTDEKEPEQKIEPVKKENDFFAHTENSENTFFNENEDQQRAKENYYQEQQRQPPPVGSNLNVGELFPTDLIVELADSVLSKTCSFILTKATKKNVPANFMAATRQEKETLKPVVKNYLNSVNFVMTPANALIVALAAIYGSKCVEAMNVVRSIKNGNPAPVINSEHKQPKETNRRKKDGKEPSAYMKKKYGL